MMSRALDSPAADEILDRTRSREPDAVLIDWRLGAAAASRIVNDLMRRDDPTPVVVQSAAQERHRARQTGAAACATPGDHPDTLLACLRELGPEDDAGVAS
jgi:DNA-binding NarL/FixJ family response regulator